MSGKVIGATFEDLKSHKALVCRRENHSSAGMAVIWSILLSDGFLIECGSGGNGEDRANVLASIVNNDRPERLSREALKGQPA